MEVLSIKQTKRLFIYIRKSFILFCAKKTTQTHQGTPKLHGPAERVAILRQQVEINTHTHTKNLISEKKTHRLSTLLRSRQKIKRISRWELKKKRKKKWNSEKGG